MLGMMLVLSFKRFWDHVMESVFETPYMIHLLRGTYLYFNQFLYLDHETVLLEISLSMAAFKMLIILKRWRAKRGNHLRSHFTFQKIMNNDNHAMRI